MMERRDDQSAPATTTGIACFKEPGGGKHVAVWDEVATSMVACRMIGECGGLLREQGLGAGCEFGGLQHCAWAAAWEGVVNFLSHNL
jgi:hypothetical protein